MKIFKTPRRIIIIYVLIAFGATIAFWVINVKRHNYDVDKLLINNWCVVQINGASQSKTYPPGQGADVLELVRFLFECKCNKPCFGMNMKSGRSYSILFFESEKTAKEIRDPVIVIDIWREGYIKLTDRNRNRTDWCSVSIGTIKHIERLIITLGVNK